MSTKFQEKTAVMKFFRDLHDHSEAYRAQFEKQSEVNAERYPGNVFRYDIRAENVNAKTIKDEADMNLLYDITQFLLDSRNQLHSRQEELRLSMEAPTSGDILRVAEDVETKVMPHFFKRRKATSNPELIIVGIDCQTFVDIFSAILSKESDRVTSTHRSFPTTAATSPTKKISSPSKRQSMGAKRMSMTTTGRSERRALQSLFEAMDSDDNGVITWDHFLQHMTVLRLGNDLAEEQREGKLVMKAIPLVTGQLLGKEQAWPRVGSGRAVPFGCLTYFPQSNCIIALTNALEDNKVTPSSVAHKVQGEEHKYFIDDHPISFVDIFSADDHRLMYRTDVHYDTTAVVFVPSLKGEAAFYGSFHVSGKFQLYKIQPLATKGGVDLIPSPAPIQVPKVPTAVLFNEISGLVFGVSREGELFAYEPSMLVRPYRMTHCFSLIPLFHEPITTLIQSQDGSQIFCSCLFGGIAIYSAAKAKLLFKYIAMFNGKEIGIRTMVYLPDTNVLVTGGYTSELHMWKAAPTKNAQAHVASLKHPADPHFPDVVMVWADLTMSTKVVMSLDRKGMLKMWDIRSGACVSQIHLGDGTGPSAAGFKVLATTPARHGRLYYLCSSGLTHHCTMRAVQLFKEMVNPIAVNAKAHTTQHCAAMTFANEESVISAMNGTLITYELKNGTITKYLPSCCGRGMVCITAMTITERKVFVGTDVGTLYAFGLHSGQRSSVFKPMKGEVSGVVVLTSGRMLVAASRAHGEAIRVYQIPEIGESGEETRVIEVEESFNIAVPTGAGVSCLGLRRISESSSSVVLWDLAGVYHQLTVEGTRLCLHSFDGSGRQQSADRRGSQASSTAEQPPRTETETENKCMNPVSKAEINFKTDKTVFFLLEEHGAARKEVRCCIDLAPNPFVASSDLDGKLQFWAAAPHDLEKVYEWDHFSARQVVASITKAVVNAMDFDSCSQKLISVDDHGCLVVWDISGFLSTMNTMTRSFSSSSDASSTTDELPMIKLLHCFYITNAKPLVSVTVMRNFEAYCVGVSDGTTRFVSLTGSVVAELQPDPKYLMEHPDKYFLHRIAEMEDLKKPKPRTRASALWAKVRQNVLGEGKVMALTVKELISRARTSTDLVQVNDDNDDDTGATKVVRQHFPIFSTPPNSPTKLKPTSSSFAVVPSSERCEVRVIDPRGLLRNGGRMKGLQVPAVTSREPETALLKSTDSKSVCSPHHVTSCSTSHHRHHRGSQSGHKSFREMSEVDIAHHITEKLLHLVAEETSTVLPPKAQSHSSVSFQNVTDDSNRKEGVALVSSYACPPPLFPPSIFKALNQGNLGMLPPADRPLGTPAWISSIVAQFDLMRKDNTSSIPLTPVTVPNVPQEVLPLVELRLPNHLFAKYWRFDDEEGVGAEPEVIEAPVVSDYQERKGVASRLSSSKRSKRSLATTSSITAPGEELQDKLHLTPSHLSRVLFIRENFEELDGLAEDEVEERHLAPIPGVAQGTSAPLPLGQWRGDLDNLLAASAPLYPLQVSPYLEPGRVPPAISPFLFTGKAGSSDDGASAEPSVIHSEFDETRNVQSSMSVRRRMLLQHGAASRPLSAMTSCSGYTGAANTSLLQSMVRCSKKVPTLRSDFIERSMTLRASDSATHEPDPHRWDIREQHRKLWVDQFERKQQRSVTSAGGGAGRVAKLRMTYARQLRDGLPQEVEAEVLTPVELSISKAVHALPRSASANRPRTPVTSTSGKPRLPFPSATTSRPSTPKHLVVEPVVVVPLSSTVIQSSGDHNRDVAERMAEVARLRSQRLGH